MNYEVNKVYPMPENLAYFIEGKIEANYLTSELKDLNVELPEHHILKRDHGGFWLRKSNGYTYLIFFTETP